MRNDLRRESRRYSNLTGDVMPRPKSRAFELRDPRRPELPRFVGAGTGAQPWRIRWDRRALDFSPLGRWFQELGSIGAEPVEDWTWLSPEWVHNREALRLARARNRQIIEWAGVMPTWLLSGRRWPLRSNPTPCVRWLPDGSRERYRSTYEAAKAAGVSWRGIGYYLSTGCNDRQGAFWTFAPILEAPI